MRKSFLLTVTLLNIVLFCSCSLLNDDTNLIAVKSNNLWGYVDHKGSYVINPQFESAHPFFDGLARIVSDGKVGYISTKGKYIVLPQYQDGTDFSEGYAFVVTDNGYPMCIDTKGKEVFTFNGIQTIYTFSEGLAAYTNKSGKYGYVDTKGSIVISPRYDEAGPFSDGLAPVRINDKYGYTDPQGNVVIACQFVEARPFHEGLAAVSNGKMYGFINKKGEYVINPQFEAVDDFSDGLAAFSNGKMVGYIDKSGTYAINPQFEDGGSFNSGLACISFGNMCGYVNKEGKTVINPQFDRASSFNGNIAMIESNKLIGFIDKKGKYVINPQFEAASFYSDSWGYVTSTYYDVSDFLGKLFGSEKSLGNIVLSTFKQGATLKTVAENKYFSSADVDDNTTLRYIETEQWYFSEDVRLTSIYFNFTDPIYDSYYDYYYYESNRTYNWSVPLNNIICRFYLTDKAYGKGSALASSVANQLKMKQVLSETKSFDGAIYGYSTKNKQGVIISYDNSELLFMVFPIGETYFDEITKKIQNDSEGNHEEVIDTAAVENVVY